MDFGKIVREVMDQARRKAGSGPALAAELRRLGVGQEDRYSESGISNWVRGRTTPPADVLLAAAFLGSTSLDAKLAAGAVEAHGDDSDLTVVGKLQSEVRELQRQYARVEALLMDLYARTGQSYPHTGRTEGRDRQAC